ncbi:peroxidase family protein [Nostocoides sp. F2B08]|uniref:peroxidase family protein n=1 Tax=Nostocoides sp. F2B08 TaxID=2653936 RepID=UPI00186B2F5A|nr:peroxidase family protein [Tetrasphaera sp. F2B08]
MSQTSSRRRTRVRRLVALLTSSALAVPLVAMNTTTAAAVTEPDPPFYLNANDLDFILRQIQIAEAHADGNDLLCATPTDRSGKCVPSPALPLGLRTVDGSYNNLLEGRSTWGAGDQPFKKWLEPYYRQADAPLTAPGAPPAGDTSMCEPGLTCYEQWEPGHIVYDAKPREISNLIVDQSTDNPAAVNAATHLPGAEIRPDGTIFLPNMAPDEGLSAQTNAFFTFFGQFFDHGLDLVDKGGNGTLVVPLAADDPIRQVAGFNPQAPYLILSRATRSPGPDNVIGTEDDVHNNETTPFVDQNQTYTSHPSHQVFVREYVLVDGVPQDTGRLLDGAAGGLATWNEVKAQARDILGIELSDARALDVPQVVTDPYGNFVPGPGGFPMIVTDNGGSPLNVEGSITSPANADDALTTGHAFLDDIAHGATPVIDENGDLQPRFDENGDPILDENGQPVLSGYDNVSLGAHFITGDGRGNENIALTAVHTVFHGEHNRQIATIQEWLDRPEYEQLKRAYQGLDHSWPNKRAADVLPGPEADDWSYEQRLFQAARFATEMQYQHMVFEEFGRTIQPAIDEVVFNENSYNANMDPAITAEFAHVVYRFGHSMLTEDIARQGFETGNISLLDGFLNPDAFTDGGRLTAEQGAGAIINGVVRQPSSQIDEFVIDTLRNNLLGLPLDLATINLLRGRDAGVAPLQEARRTFFEATGDVTMRPYANWTDFGNNLKNGNIFGRDASNSSLVNFVAAYGTHPSILAETTIDGKREAAALLVNGVPQGQEFISRLAAGTRYGTAALISSSHFQAGVPVVYVTTGNNFPDALAAGALAAQGPGPILLTHRDFLPVETSIELARLAPQQVVILGGELAVSASVEQALTDSGIAPVSRIAGGSRFDTAAQISQLLQPTAGQADRVYLATGMNFPDALVAAAAAARDGDPILLTDTTLPAVTSAELQRLAPQEVVILGGPLAVPAAVESAVQAAVPGVTVTRIAGETRYDTAALISAANFAANRGGTLYIATGTNFPDSLAISPVAGLNGDPVLLIPPSGEVPPAIQAEITRLAPSNIVILGGPIAIDGNAETELSQFAPTTAAAPEDRMDFMFSTGAWANAGGTTTTGLEDVDFWTGGLAERVNPFGGMLGSTFNFVFEEQMEALQFGDRFYYLFRNQGNQLFAALEASSFTALIERTTDASNLPANIFAVQDPVIQLEGITQPYPGTLRQDPDGTWRWVGDEHVEIHGTPADDRIRVDEGDDSVKAKDGNDIVEGGAGNDILAGGDGNDVLTDLFGDDVLKGEWGNDVLNSGPGFDILHGGPGHDFVANGGDIDTVFAGDGNDVVLGQTGRMNVFAGEDEDWVEGSRHADLLQGDNANQFQNDVIGGNDVVIGREGNDDIEGEGGDDILVGEWFGTDRHLGNMGFDWITYYGETANVDIDFLITLLQRPDVTAVRDRYDLLEAMSGSFGDDQLKGMSRELDGPEGVEPELHKMTEETLDTIDGLREFLQPADHDNYALRFMTTGPVVDTDGVNNILVGGPGSDTIQGRGGDDVIDGDLMLRVQLGLVNEAGEIVERQDSAAAYQERMYRGEIDPGDLRIIRELVDLDEPGSLDTAVYTGPMAEYEITDLGDGYHMVAHVAPNGGAGEAEEAEGADVIRNIEVVQFSDNCFDLRTGEACESIATAVLDDQTPVEDEQVTAELLDLDGQPFDLSTADSVVVEWFMGEGATPAEITELEQIVDGTGAPVTGFSFTPDDGTVAQFLQARVTLVVGGVTYVVTTPWTENPVENVNDEPVINDLVTPGGVVVGQNVQAAPPTDGDGVETAAEAGWVYRFETAAAEADFADPSLVTTVQEGTQTQYTLQAADEGRFLRVVVEYTDDLGQSEAPVTNVIGPVTAAP